MKSLISSILMFLCLNTILYSQVLKIDDNFPIENQVNDWLKNLKRDSTDKTCLKLLSDFYECYESDLGQMNPLMISSILNLQNYSTNPSIANMQIAVLLSNYFNSLSIPKNGLIWIELLKQEYSRVYGGNHPLIYLFQGESLINNHQKKDAYFHFMEFKNLYPKSVTAMCYIYQTETDNNMKKTWLSILKAEHPNHWIVSKYKE